MALTMEKPTAILLDHLKKPAESLLEARRAERWKQMLSSVTGAGRIDVFELFDPWQRSKNAEWTEIIGAVMLESCLHETAGSRFIGLKWEPRKTWYISGIIEPDLLDSLTDHKSDYWLVLPARKAALAATHEADYGLMQWK